MKKKLWKVTYSYGFDHETLLPLIWWCHVVAEHYPDAVRVFTNQYPDKMDKIKSIELVDGELLV